MSAEEAALLRSMVALVRQRYGLDEIEAAAYVVEMPSRIKALEAENAALRAEVKAAEDGFVAAADQSRILAGDLAELRARAVPALEWDTYGVARVDLFTLRVQSDDWWIAVKIDRSAVVIRDGTGGKSACEAAFLRLVGCKNDRN